MGPVKTFEGVSPQPNTSQHNQNYSQLPSQCQVETSHQSFRIFRKFSKKIPNRHRHKVKSTILINCNLGAWCASDTPLTPWLAGIPRCVWTHGPSPSDLDRAAFAHFFPVLNTDFLEQFMRVSNIIHQEKVCCSSIPPITPHTARTSPSYAESSPREPVPAYYMRHNCVRVFKPVSSS